MKPYKLLLLLVGCFLFGQCDTTRVNDQEAPLQDSIPDSLTISQHDPDVDIQDFLDCSLWVTATKMNVMYRGIGNPVRIEGGGETSEMYTKTEGVEIERQSSNKFFVTPSKSSGVTLAAVSGEKRTEVRFRVKQIPDPVASLGNSRGGAISVGEFRAQAGVVAWISNFDFDVRCEISSFELWRITADGSRQSVLNVGAHYTTEARALVSKARSDDVYLFHKISARCSGDISTRSIGTMSFFIR